ncbi:hypothetical protein BCR34DRAFT_43846 [Clohesyomyces aquaticus]|uniref:Uncharacterized protein n=1 Tax=Clohesyomyces aquaticus TaxID=1231657 RepID=A0A1Y1Z634_9PLEO|nr:hypothetical protein BCR34DRAFT_43846 [Clohesyomyces aquaticus]
MLRYNSTMASATTFGNSNAGFQANVINGNVHAEFRLPPGRSRTIWGSTRPEPALTVPNALALLHRQRSGLTVNPLGGLIP